MEQFENRTREDGTKDGMPLSLPQDSVVLTRTEGMHPDAAYFYMHGIPRSVAEAREARDQPPSGSNYLARFIIGITRR